LAHLLSSNRGEEVHPTIAPPPIRHRTSSRLN
jgi:hypothetical protein